MGVNSWELGELRRCAGSTTGRVLLTSSAPEKPLRSRSQPEAGAAGARAAHSALDGDLVHLEELQIVRADSLRLSWKVGVLMFIKGDDV